MIKFGGGGLPIRMKWVKQTYLSYLFSLFDTYYYIVFYILCKKSKQHLKSRQKIKNSIINLLNKWLNFGGQNLPCRMEWVHQTHFIPEVTPLEHRTLQWKYG